jgi:hypothetical protein
LWARRGARDRIIAAMVMNASALPTYLGICENTRLRT